jgi:hypothetical protein
VYLFPGIILVSKPEKKAHSFVFITAIAINQQTMIKTVVYGYPNAFSLVYEVCI